MATFNTMSFLTGAVNDLLKQDSGAFKNIDAMRAEIRKAFARSARASIIQDIESQRRTGVQSTAQLFSAGTRAAQAEEQQQSALTQLNLQQEQSMQARRAQAERVAAAQLPVAYQEFQRKQQPGFLGKIAGAVIGGAASAFMPAVAAKLFPSLFNVAGTTNSVVKAAQQPTTGQDFWQNWYQNMNQTGGVV